MYVNVHICQYGEYTLKQQDTRHSAASLDVCLSTVSAFRQLTSAGAALTSDEVAVRTLHDSGTGGAILHSGVCFYPCLLFSTGRQGSSKMQDVFPRRAVTTWAGKTAICSCPGHSYGTSHGARLLGSDLERDKDS